MHKQLQKIADNLYERVTSGGPSKMSIGQNPNLSEPTKLKHVIAHILAEKTDAQQVIVWADKMLKLAKK